MRSRLSAGLGPRVGRARVRHRNSAVVVALVRAGARFDKGVMIERPDEDGEVAA